MTDNIKNLSKQAQNEITEICLKALENPASKNQSYLAFRLDNALKANGYQSDLQATLGKCHFLEAHLDMLMEDKGFSRTVITEVRNTLKPTQASFIQTFEMLKAQLPKLSVALYAENGIGIIADYKQAMGVVQPYIDTKAISSEAASEYAHAVTLRKLEHNLTMGLSSELGNRALGEWVRDHPEISSKVLTELGLEDVRKMQDTLDLSRSYEPS